MAKIYVNTVKYQITAEFEISGIVEKHDIIGAIFGQSEGLIGEDLDLRELQKSGKIGRIDVETETHSGKTTGKIIVPSSMDTVKTALLAASVEAVDKVGPCDSTFKITKIEDMRTQKRQAVKDRAKELLKQLTQDMPETGELTEAIRSDIRTGELKSFGKEKLSCGPDLDKEEEVIVVEGRADVINMLKHGIKNVIAIDGANIPDSIVELSKKKKLTLFVDGDRGGDLIVKKIMDLAKIEYVAKAPAGKEVEELMGKEILMKLRKKVPAEDFGKRSEYRDRPPRGRSFRDERPRGRGIRSDRGTRDERPTGRSPRDRAPRERGTRDERPSRGPRRESQFGERPEPRFGERRDSRRGPPRPGPSGGKYADEKRYSAPEPTQDLGEYAPLLKELETSLKARLYGKGMKVVKEVGVRDLLSEMGKAKKVETVVFDGIVTKRLLEQAEKSGIKTLVAIKKGKIEESDKVKVFTSV